MEFFWSLDFPILFYIQEHFKSAFGDVFFPIVTLFGDGGIFWIVLAAVLLIIPKTRKFGLAMAIALAFEAIVCNVIIKPIVNRPRPFEYLDSYMELLVNMPTDASFPSGHTGASFACAGALIFTKSKFCIPATILALLIAFSRLYLFVHFPTDVLAGMGLGLISGFIGALIMTSIMKSVEDRKKAKLG